MGRYQHPLEVHRFEEMLDEGLEVHEMSVRDLLRNVLFELQRMNKHLQLITDEEIGNDN